MTTPARICWNCGAAFGRDAHACGGKGAGPFADEPEQAHEEGASQFVEASRNVDAGPRSMHATIPRRFA